MSRSIRFGHGAVEIELSGLDALISFRRTLRIPVESIVSAQIMDVREAKKNLGLRIGGGYFPKRFATGYFLSRGGMKGRQFWSVYRDTEVLVIDRSDGDEPRRVVFQTADRAALAAKISSSVSAR